MAVTKYTRDLDTDFGGAVNVGNLIADIHANVVITTALDNDRVDVDEGARTVDIWFKAALTAAEETELDTVVIANHDSTPGPPEVSHVEIDGGRVHSSPRPVAMKTYFTSVGDGDPSGTGATAAGPQMLIFNLSAGDSSKEIELFFNEDVLIKDGYVRYEGAPLGSSVSATGHAYGLLATALGVPDGTKVSAFVEKSALLGTGRDEFNTDDYGVLPKGASLKITVENSDGTGDADPAAAFKLIARIEMFRLTTVGTPQ